MSAEGDLRLRLKNSPFAEGKHTFLKKVDENFKLNFILKRNIKL